MNTLQGNSIYLRALEPTDLEFLYLLENEESVWEMSNTVAPYSKFVLKQYLDNAYQDIYEAKQLRLVICTSEGDKAIGFIDCFDFDPKHRKVGVGIIIFSEEDRGKGRAKEALKVLCDYAFQHLNVHQVYANISEDNTASIALFEKQGFEHTGTKRDWIFINGHYKNELSYQLLRNT